MEQHSNKARSNNNDLIEHQVTLLFANNRTGIITNLAIGLLMLLILWNEVPESLLLSWYGIVIGVSGLRFLLAVQFSKNRHFYPFKYWRWAFCAGALSAGLYWGLGGIYLFPHGSIIHEMLLIVILAGMAAGATSVLSADRLALFCFVGAMLVPFSLFLISAGDMLYTYIALSALLYGVVLSFTSNIVHNQITDFYLLQKEKTALADEIFSAKQALEKANLSLSREISDRKKAQKQLQQLTSEQEQKIKTRTEELITANRSLQKEINLRHLAEKELIEAKESAEIILTSISDGVIATDSNSVITYANEVAASLLEKNKATLENTQLKEVLDVVDETSNTRLYDFIHDSISKGHIGQSPPSAVLNNKSDKKIPVEITVSPIKTKQNKLTGAVVVIRDVSESRELRRQLAYFATHDSLTGVANRREFENQVIRSIESAQQHNLQHVLLYLDLDEFKIVNDTCGHSAGDELLKHITRMLHECIRDTDVLGRLGGDEFGILINRCPMDRAVNIAQTIIQSMKEFTLGISIGLIEINHHSKNISQVMKSADIACYTAKDLGRNRIHIQVDQSTSPEWDIDQIRSRANLLKQAVKDERFVFTYQPIVKADDSQDISHYELFLRLMDDNNNLILPIHFLPAASRYRLMAEIDKWVISHIFERYKQIAGKLHTQSPMISVNLSEESCIREDLIPFIRSEISKHGVPAEQICFEINETIALTKPDAVGNLLKRLKNLGCKFALDDFTGSVSAFSHLKDFPFDFIKIDGSFIKNIHTNQIDHAMVESIQKVSRLMNMQTIAENVETLEVAETLRQINVDYLQGYVFAEPLPLDNLPPAWRSKH